MKPYIKGILKYFKRIIKILIIPVTLFGIGWFIWANSFITIIPPNKYNKFKDGAIVWTHYKDRTESIYGPDFISEINMLSNLLMGYIYYLKDGNICKLPYSKTFHEFVSDGIGTTVKGWFDGEKEDKKQVDEHKPGVKKRALMVLGRIQEEIELIGDFWCEEYKRWSNLW